MSGDLREHICVHNDSPLPTIYIVSDSLGATAHTLARAAAGQFGVPEPYIEILPKARNFDEIVNFLTSHQERYREAGLKGDLVVFFTLVDPEMRSRWACTASTS